jgi:hypothetical protein
VARVPRAGPAHARAPYFQVLFTDQRGWNIRNDVCHGISPVQAFSWPSLTDRIFHALLILATMREREGKSGGQQ